MTQQNRVGNIAVSYVHKGLEVFALDIFLKAVIAGISMPSVPQ